MKIIQFGPWLVVLLIVFTVLVVNLAFSVKSFDANPQTDTGPVQSSVASSTITQHSEVTIAGTNSEYLFYYYLGAGIFVLIALIVYSWLRAWRRKKHTEHIFEFTSPIPEGPLSTLIAIGLIALALLGPIGVVYYLGNYLTQNSYGGTPVGIEPYVAIVGFAAVTAASAFGLFLFYKSGKSVTVANPEVLEAKRSPERVKEFKAILENLVYSLDHDRDYRSTIIQTYKELGSVLEENGVPQNASLTPREFEIKANQILGIRSKYIHEVTALFERARYSDQELTYEDAIRAKDCFNQLRLEIEKEQLKDNEVISNIPSPVSTKE